MGRNVGLPLGNVQVALASEKPKVIFGAHIVAGRKQLQFLLGVQTQGEEWLEDCSDATRQTCMQTMSSIQARTPSCEEEHFAQEGRAC